MPRRPPPAPLDPELLNQVNSALAAITHKLHVTERAVRESMPKVAARLRALRTLVAEIREELQQEPAKPSKR